MTWTPCQTVQLRARTHHAADTFVADRRDRDLLFYFYRAVAAHEGVVHPWPPAPLSLEFAVLLR
jgi:hypothetical protein